MPRGWGVDEVVALQPDMTFGHLRSMRYPVSLPQQVLRPRWPGLVRWRWEGFVQGQPYQNCASGAELCALRYSDLVALQSQHALAHYLLGILHAPCQNHISYVACMLSTAADVPSQPRQAATVLQLAMPVLQSSGPFHAPGPP